MELFLKLLRAGCFSYNDVVKLTGNKKTADSFLLRYKSKGLIVSVKKNLYAAINPETMAAAATSFEIASCINEHSYVSHHSAFTYYGMANQVSTKLYVSSPARFNNFEFNGTAYVYVHQNINSGIVSPTPRVRITDLERTILDSIKDFTKIGGLEELLRCLLMVTFVDEVKLLDYLPEYKNQFLYQKTGYILSHYREEIKLSSEFFEKCRKNIGQSKRYLYPELKEDKSGSYSSEWGLCVPSDLLRVIDEGGDEIV
jgi:predicted transcriptional regulator of viral defense system